MAQLEGEKGSLSPSFSRAPDISFSFPEENIGLHNILSISHCQSWNKATLSGYRILRLNSLILSDPDYVYKEAKDYIYKE